MSLYCHCHIFDKIVLSIHFTRAFIQFKFNQEPFVFLRCVFVCLQNEIIPAKKA